MTFQTKTPSLGDTVAVMHTNMGVIKIKLFVDEVPVTTKNFIELAKKDYVKAYKAIEKFALAFEKQWNIENKPTGFDVQDIRLGGLLRRTDSCRRRLLDYTSGKIDEIPELAFELLEGTVPSGSNNCYGLMATPNRLSHKIV